MTGAKKILQWAKGFRGRAKNCISIARERVEKSLQYVYRDRRTLKRDMRSLWIQRINAGAREHGLKYNQLIYGLAAENILINRKALSELAQNEPASFKALCDTAKRQAEALAVADYLRAKQLGSGGPKEAGRQTTQA